MAVTIAGGKLHRRVCAGGILSQQRLNQADALEEVAPIQRREQTHAGDDVADGDLRRGLALMLSMNDLLNACTLAGQLLLEPVHHRRHSRILFTKALSKLDYKRLRNFL